jgi:hypothetical protein
MDKDVTHSIHVISSIAATLFQLDARRAPLRIISVS